MSKLHTLLKRLPIKFYSFLKIYRRQHSGLSVILSINHVLGELWLSEVGKKPDFLPFL